MISLNTATLPVILFLLGLVAVKASDALLLSEPLQAREITLGTASVESMEAGTADKPENTDRLRVIKALLEDHMEGETVFEQKGYLQASEKEKALILRELATELLKMNAHQAVIHLVENFSLNERISKGLQFQYALALTRDDKSEKAVVAYNELLAIQPDHVAAVINLGLLFNRLELYQDAASILQHAVGISDGNRKAKAMSALATTRVNQNDYSKAEKLFADSINYRPEHAATWTKLAETRAVLGRPFHTVVRAYEKAIELSDNQYRYQKKYGEYLLGQLAFEQATEILEKALDESGKDDQIRRLLAWAMFESGQWLNSRSHWKWLSTNAGLKKYRLLGEHMVLLIDQQDHLLKEPESTKDEFAYVRALLAENRQLYSDAEHILGNIGSDSIWFLRAQRRLELIQQTKTGLSTELQQVSIN